MEEAERVLEDELVRLGLNLRGKVVAPKLAELHRLGVQMAEQESAWALARLESNYRMPIGTSFVRWLIVWYGGSLSSQPESAGNRVGSREPGTE